MERWVQQTFSPHPINHWFQGLARDLLHDGRHRYWSRCICAHSTHVKTCIALSDTFVVLRSWKWDDGVAVAGPSEKLENARTEISGSMSNSSTTTSSPIGVAREGVDICVTSVQPSTRQEFEQGNL
jgi:hypothetical protein